MLRKLPRRTAVVFLLIALCLHPAGAPAAQSPEGTAPAGNDGSLLDFFVPDITQEEAAADLEYLCDTVIRSHSFVRTTKSAFRSLYQEKVDGLAQKYTALGFYRYAADMLTALQCGHSMLQPSQKILDTFNLHNAYFPLGVFVRNGAIFVTGNFYDPAIPKGAQILEINGVPAASIVETLMQYISSDGHNVTFKEYILSNHFYYYYTLFAAQTRTYRITYADPDTLETRVYETEGRKLGQVAYGLPDQGSDIYYSLYPTYAKIVINSFSVGKNGYQEIYSVFDSFFQAVDQKHIRNIIVDVRGNTGGDPYISAYFLRYILPVAEPYFESGTWGYADLSKTQTRLEPHYTGTLYVLMDGGSFSTTGHFLSKIKDQDFAVLVGEQSGATWLATDGSVYHTLPVSQNRMKLSTAAYRTFVHSTFSPDGILPDIAVTPDVQDVIVYRDTIYQYVLNELIAPGDAP